MVNGVLFVLRKVACSQLRSKEYRFCLSECLLVSCAVEEPEPACYAYESSPSAIIMSGVRQRTSPSGSGMFLDATTEQTDCAVMLNALCRDSIVIVIHFVSM